MNPRHRVSGKELLVATMRHESVDAVPWTPFAGVHAGKLKGYTAIEVLQDGDKLVDALVAANQQYQPDGQPVLFDLQVEAEILGCELAWSDTVPPMVTSHPLAERLEVPKRLPEKTDGRLPLILEAKRQMKRAVGDSTALYGLICGPFTLASHLRGTDIFLDPYDNPGFLAELIDFAARVNLRMAELYVEAGMDVIAVVDPVVSQISPALCRRFLAGPCSDIFDAIRQAGVHSSFFVCGDATKNIEEMCKMGPDSISIDENIDIDAAKKITDRYNIAIGGNLPLTSLMLLGTQQDNMKYVVDMLDRLDRRNLIVAPGCDMPYDTPPENVIGIMQAIHDPESVRRLLANYHASGMDMDVELPDYGRLPRPLVEVFTIDSAACPACFYMVDAAQHAKKRMGDRIDVVEYKATARENIARAKKLGLKSLPCLLINGRLRYASVIPSKTELAKEIERYL